MPVILYGASYSVYVRTVRLTLEEKAVPYQLEEVDIYGMADRKNHLNLHPFGKIPVFQHNDFYLYETRAITQYIDAVFPIRPLSLSDPRRNARMNQIISILDNYGYDIFIRSLFTECVEFPMRGQAKDGARIEKIVSSAKRCLAALEALAEGKPYLCGELTLADLHAAPMFTYLLMAEEGRRLLHSFFNLKQWWNVMCQRPSMLNTRFPLEARRP